MKLSSRRIGRIIVVALAALPVHPAAAGDWPQFRGPSGSGVAAEDGLLETWPEAGPRIVWARPIGVGYSAVTVVGDRLYTMDATAEGEQLLCLDARSGETLWKKALGPFVESELGDGGPRSTPAVAGGLVLAVTSQSRFVALDAADGSPTWEADLTSFGPVPRFGYASSPLVDGDAVILEVGAPKKGPGVVAFHRGTGEILWQALDGPAGYSSALAVEIGGVHQYLFFRRAGQEMVSLGAEGEVLWRHPTPDALSTIVTPVFLPPDHVFISASEDAFGGRMLRVVGDEADFHVEQVWHERLMRNHFNGSVLVDGHLYGFDNGTFRCLDAWTGERRWAKRGFGKGSLVAAGDLLYVLGDGGETALVHATPDAYREAGRAQVMEGRSWTSPSLAGGRLYLRDFDEIACLDVRGDAPTSSESGTGR